MSERAPSSGRRRRADGTSTERRLLRVALDLFRRRGVDGTTMRDVAAASGLSLGAAYHYFPSKESIVLAYYRATELEHAARMEAELGAIRETRERIRFVLRSKLAVLHRDQRLLSGLTRVAIDPTSPLSVLATSTEDVRLRSIAAFAAALDTPEVAADARAPLACALWSAHLGVLLFFLHDRSPRQRRTWQLADEVSDLFADLLPLAGSPVGWALVHRVGAILEQAGLAAGTKALLVPRSTAGRRARR